MHTEESGRLGLVAICLGFLMITLDATIVNVALPAVRASVGGGLAGLQWVVNSYTVGFAALLLSAGALADRYGARRVFRLGLAGFALASAACSLAGSLGALVAARAVQGVGAAALMPTSLALIVHQHADPSTRARALGVWGGMSGIGLAAGPVLGGFAVTYLGWRWIFLVNLPVAALAYLLTGRVRETARHPHRFDLPGQLLGVGALALASAGFITGGSAGWSSLWTIGLLAAALATAVGFLLVERAGAAPMLPLRLFALPGFAPAVGIGLLFNFSLYGTLFCVALFVNTGGAADRAGLVMLPMMLVVGVCAFASGRIIARAGFGRPLRIGAAAAVVGAGMLALVDVPSQLVLLLAGSMVYALCALAMPAMTAAAMAAVPAARTGAASGVLNAARQTGGAFGVALLGAALPGADGRPSLHLSMILAAVAFLIALGLAARLRPTGAPESEILVAQGRKE